MPRKKAAVPIVPLHEEVQFMEPVEVEVEVNQVSRALALAANHEGDAQTYLCKIGSRTLKVKVWTVTT